MHSGDYGVVSGKAMLVADLHGETQGLIGEVEKEQTKVDIALSTHNPKEEDVIVIFEQMRRMQWCIDLRQRIDALKQPPNQSRKRPPNVSFTYGENQWPDDDHEIRTCANYESSLEDYESRFPKWRTVLALLDKYNKLSSTLEEASSKAKQPSLPLVILAQKVTYLAHSIYELSGGLFEDNMDRSCDKETDIKLKTATAKGMMRQTLTTIKTTRNEALENYNTAKHIFWRARIDKRIDRQLPADCTGNFFDILQCVKNQLPRSEERVQQMLSKVDELVDAMKDSRNALWRSIRYLEAARQRCTDLKKLRKVPRFDQEKAKRQFDANNLRHMAAIECVQTRLVAGVKNLPIKRKIDKLDFPAEKLIDKRHKEHVD